MINAKYSQAIENQINCFFNIDLNGFLHIEDIDLCAIFGNTLDNAIEACVKLKQPSQRKTTVKAPIDRGYFSYSIANSFDGQIIKKNNRFISQKHNTQLHGIGIENVNDIVNKYGVLIDINYHNSDFEVIIAIKIA